MIDALARALGLGDDAEAILKPLRAFYDTIDQRLAAAAKGLDLPCKQGCDACCHESVFLSAPEFLAVADHLQRTFTAEDRARVVREMTTLAEKFEDELELLETIPPGAERDEVSARIKFRCPFLSAAGACTIYDARELNARTFGQSWDHLRDEPYGCTWTRDRLVVIGAARSRQLHGAREARQELASKVPGTETVHVYPWWFAKYGALI